MPLDLNSFSDKSSKKHFELEQLTGLVNKEFCQVKSISHIRNGNYYVLEINNEYIVRIRRLHSDGANDGEYLKNLNEIFEKEINITNNIFDYISMLWEKDSSIPLIKYIHESYYEGHKIGIYKKIEGKDLETSKLVLDVKRGILSPIYFGIDLGYFLSLLHSCPADKIGLSEKISIENIKKKPSSRNHSFQLIVDGFKEFKNVSELDSVGMKYIIESINYIKLSGVIDSEVGGELMVAHNAIESGHLLLNNGGLSGVIDFEHAVPCINGFKDLSQIYSNFILPHSGFRCTHNLPKKDNLTDLISGFIWNSFVESYFSSVHNRKLNSNEIHLIEIFGLISMIYKLILSQKKIEPVLSDCIDLICKRHFSLHRSWL